MSATDCLHVTDDEAKVPPNKPKGTNRCAYNPGNNEGHAAFNTGVVFFRPSTAAKAFAAAWRHRLLSVEKTSWVDDQLAFNELVWHGFRNHPSRAVRAASPDGKTIWVRMGRGEDPAAAAAAGGGGVGGGVGAMRLTQATRATIDALAKSHYSAELEETDQLPEPKALPVWSAGWRDLLSNPNEAFDLSARGAEASALAAAHNASAHNASARGAASYLSERLSEGTAADRIGPMPMAFKLAPLPARHFCSGHLFWEQQGLARRDCMTVHTTFVEGGNRGKLWRFRDAGLWLLEPPSHFEPSTSAKYLAFEPPEPPAPAHLAPLINKTRCPKYVGPHAPCAYTDKYKAGWLVPDALAMSPRLRQHLELVRRHIHALRDALALSLSLGRVLVLPRLLCLCDRSEGPLVLQQCKYEASELPTPFVCPLTHIFDIVRFASIAPDMGSAGSNLEGVATVTFRESSFFTNPLTPAHVRTNHTRVRVAADAAAMQAARERGEAAVLLGTSDVQALATLGPSSAFAHAPVLRLERAEGVFGGFVDGRQRAAFEAMIQQSSMLSGSWCCSSWYKPSGSIEYVGPHETLAWRPGCGITKPWEPERSPQCVDQLQAYRRAQQTGPAKLEYVLKSGQQGKDGYYGLKALRRLERGLAFETCPKGGADDPFNGTLSTCCQSY